MLRQFPRFRLTSRHSLLVGVFMLAAAAWVLVAGSALAPDLERSSESTRESTRRKPTGSPQLVRIDPFPVMDGEMCQWMPASAGIPLAVALQQELRERAARPSSGEVGRPAVDADREPIRVIRDKYPTYSSVAVDIERNEMVLQDENLFQILVYDRTANTPPTATMTEPKRMIGGLNTHVEFNCGLYVDQKSGDIYSVTNDTVDTLTVWSREARGNVKPNRELYTPHGTFGIAVDEGRQEMFLAIQHANSVVAYRKQAEGKEKPLRTIMGVKTQLEDPHGIAVDPKNGWIFISNHGHGRPPEGGAGPGGIGWGLAGLDMAGDRNAAPIGGYFEPPSITVYALEADGDVAPLRIIEGPRARLNWPSNMYYDPDHEELFVANDADDSILVFRGSDSGNAAPLRVLTGPKTGIKNPTGIFIDPKNQELVVANMGNHSATTYRRDANGDTPPLRTLRAGPLGMQALAIGNPGAIAYDFKREEFLVPN